MLATFAPGITEHQSSSLELRITQPTLASCLFFFWYMFAECLQQISGQRVVLWQS
jgi:hypothetical protein